MVRNNIKEFGLGTHEYHRYDEPDGGGPTTATTTYDEARGPQDIHFNKAAEVDQQFELGISYGNQELAAALKAKEYRFITLESDMSILIDSLKGGYLKEAQEMAPAMGISDDTLQKLIQKHYKAPK